VEIAICLAIIGFALVAIIGVLPIGMNTQRDNRQETIINQDATVLLNDIRSGARGAEDLTNYVYAITNYWTLYRINANSIVPDGPVGRVNGYTYANASVTAPVYNQRLPSSGGPYCAIPLTNNAAIISLLSTPEFIFSQPGFPPVPSLSFARWRYSNRGSVVECYSNHVVAYVRSLSGLAAEKPPQDNPILQGDTFTYHLYCVNASMPLNTNLYFNSYNAANYDVQLAANQRELRLTFLWPQYPNGKVGNGRHTFRATIAGQLQWVTNYYNGLAYYFYQPQFFTNSP
jgi:hypothetical protein